MFFDFGKIYFFVDLLVINAHLPKKNVLISPTVNSYESLKKKNENEIHDK